MIFLNLAKNMPYSYDHNFQKKKTFENWYPFQCGFLLVPVASMAVLADHEIVSVALLRNYLNAKVDKMY